jgi:hypothetical protein
MATMTVHPAIFHVRIAISCHGGIAATSRGRPGSNAYRRAGASKTDTEAILPRSLTKYWNGARWWSKDGESPGHIAAPYSKTVAPLRGQSRRLGELAAGLAKVGLPAEAR